MRFFVVVLLLLIFPWSTDKVHGQASITVSAEHAVVMDGHTGEVIFSKKATEQAEIASLTKVMTAIVALEQGTLKENVQTSERAIRTTGSSIYLQKDESLPLEDLLYGLMLRSGNDAAVAIAEHIGGSVEGFTFLMNEKATLLGLEQTSFKNPHGLDEANHLSSAYDVAELMRYSMQNQQFRNIASANSYRSDVRTYQWNNKNRLLTELYEFCIAGKTGFTKKAGRTLVTVAEKDQQSFIVVTLNASDDWNDHIKLYDWAFKQQDSTEPITNTLYDNEDGQSFFSVFKQIWMHLWQVNGDG